MGVFNFIILILAILHIEAQGPGPNYVCYDPCGCFTDGYPFNLRPPPMSPWAQEIIWKLYTRENPVVAYEMTLPFNGSTITPPANFDPSKPLKFLIHGWGSNPDGAFTDMKDAFLQRGDYNVIVVDWRVGAGSIYYPSSASNTRVVGACSEYIARALNNGDLSRTHCIGHSLGGQTCGYMGQTSEGTLNRISGLDPAGPWFNSNETEIRLDPDDAILVDAIHTNADQNNNDSNVPTLGTPYQVADIDFFPNKGQRQPACPPIGNGCDHGIVVSYYIYSITANATTDCVYRAHPCASEEAADTCGCETCTEGVDCQVMGYTAHQYPGRGTFFLRTTADYPYCETPADNPCAVRQ